MPRVNVEDEIWNDGRFFRLSVKLGGRDRAIGQLVIAWRTAQPYWKVGRRGIPQERWKGEDLSSEIISVGLAELIDGEIFMRGSKTAFDWLHDRADNARLAGLASADARRSKDGTAQPKGGKQDWNRTESNENRTESNDSNGIERFEPSSLLSSPLLSSSKKKECPSAEIQESNENRTESNGIEQTALAPLGGPLVLIPDVLGRPRRRSAKPPLFSEADRDLAKDWIVWVHETHPQINLKEEKAADDLRKVRQYLGYEPFQMCALFKAIQQDDFWCHQCKSPAGLLTKSKNGFKKIDNFLNRKEIKKNAEKATVQEMTKGVKSIQEIMRDRRREANGSQNNP